MSDVRGEERRTIPQDLHLVTLGQRVRHLRRSRRMTLAELGRRVGRAPSQLSLLENGRREPKLSLVSKIAAALDVSVNELLSPTPPTRRAALEIALEEAQRDPRYQALGLPHLRVGPRVPSEVLEHLVALYDELKRRDSRPTATPEDARAATAELRRKMRERGNYFGEIERLAIQSLTAVDYRGGPLSDAHVGAIVAHHGFSIHYAEDLPGSVRSVTDLRHRRIYLRSEQLGMHTPKAVVLQALGHVILDHRSPRDYADFLRQRVEANYFAAAVLVPERAAVPFLKRAKADRDLAIEDLRDAFSVSYEMAAHRFTNLATRHLDLRCHFVRNDEAGIIYKAYENDGLIFPADASGAIEGQRMCRRWAGRQVFTAPERFPSYYQYTDTPDGTHWCVAHVDPTRERHFAVTIGVRYEDSRWFRGRETRNRAVSECPSGSCCQRPPAELASRWQGWSWPSARAHSHVLAVLPPGAFPGVDETDVYGFLERHAPPSAES